MSETDYDAGVVRYFAIATIVWGIVGMAVGLLLAAQLAWPALNFDTPWLSYGRIRPLHTNAVIFAFGGCDGQYVLCRAENLPHTSILTWTRVGRVLGLAAGHSCSSNHAAHGDHKFKGIC